MRSITSWLVRIGYLLCLACLPSMVIKFWEYLPNIHKPNMISALFRDLDPLRWLDEWCENIVNFPVAYSLGIFCVPCFLWLLYSWLRKPNLVKAAILLIIAVVFAPYAYPLQRIELWEQGKLPLVQTWDQLPARY